MKKLSIAVSVSLLLLCFGIDGRAESDKRVLKVMTRNMDAGTDLLWFFVVPDVATATTLTFADVLASDLPGRAGLLAKEIALEQPDVVALQEVTAWTAGPAAGGPPTIALDQLQLLLDALAALHLHYAPVGVNTLTSVAAPANPAQTVTFLDRDVILARTDLKQSELAISNVQRHIYQAKFGFPIGAITIPVLRGWISVDAKVRGKVTRIIDTHLESLSAAIPATDAVQTAQVQELLGFVKTTTLPVVLAGDFNSNAEAGPDHNGSIAALVAAGFVNTWRVFNNPGTGFTWPLFLEDVLAGSPVVPFERIDIILTRSLNVLAVERTGLTPPWPSDHAGVLATVLIEP